MNIKLIFIEDMFIQDKIFIKTKLLGNKLTEKKPINIIIIDINTPLLNLLPNKLIYKKLISGEKIINKYIDQNKLFKINGINKIKNPDE